MNTNIYASAQEIEELRNMVAQAQCAGMVAARFGPERSDARMNASRVRAHELALQHGLPEVEGFYGIDANGQFVTAG